MEAVSFNSFIHPIISIATTIVGKVSELFSISGLIGSYIVNYSIECAVTLYRAITVALHILKILCNDFTIFLHDVIKICAFFFYGTGVLASYLVEEFCNCFIYLKGLIIEICSYPVCIYVFVVSFIDNCLFCVVVAAELIKRAITLIGSGIWLLLMLIPYSLLYTISYLYVALVDSAYLIHNSLYNFIRNLYTSCCDGVIKVLEFFTDIPCEACAGLLIGVPITWLMYRKRSLLIFYGIAAYRFHVNLMKKLFRVIMTPFQQFCRNVSLCRHYMSRSRNRGTRNGSSSDELLREMGSGCYNASTSVSGGSSNDCVNLQKTLAREIEERLCSVCRERRKSVIVLPCRHLCMCEDCVGMVKRVSRICPLCRCPIARTISVYM